MDIRQLRDSFRKAKLYAERGDMLGSLQIGLQSLRVVLSSSVISTELRSAVRELVGVYATDKLLRKLADYSFAYTPGKEKALYVAMQKAHEGLKLRVITETYDEAIARKKELDQHIIRGRNYLKAGKLEDADQCFKEALKCYKDEKSIFAFIGRIFLDEKQIPRASFYLKKAHEVEPNCGDVKKMIQEVIRLSPQR